MTKKQSKFQPNSKYILSAGFASILGLLVMLTAIWYTNIISTKEKLDNIVNVLNEKTNAITQMRDLAKSRALSLHRLRILEDPFERHKEFLIFKSKLWQEFQNVNKSVFELPMDDSEVLTWKFANRLINISDDLQNKAAELIMAERYIEADLMLLNQVVPAQNDVLNQLTVLLQLQKDSKKIEVDRINWAFNKTRTTITILGATTTLLGILIALYVVKRTSMAEAALLLANKTAQDANRLKSEFLAKMTHELRTPLNAIIGFSEVLKEDAIEDKKNTYVEDLNKIESSGHHLLGIINNALDLSRIEAGKLDLAPQEFSVLSMVEGMERKLKQMSRENNNRIRINCDDDIGIIYSDESRLRQSLLNLLSNAFKFTQNGVVTFNIRRNKSEDGRDQIVFEVSDTGIGIDFSQIKNLFEPFTQLDSSINRRYGGTGLGLALSKRICELLGGDIQVHSEIGVGTTFTVILPTDMPNRKA